MEDTRYKREYYGHLTAKQADKMDIQMDLAEKDIIVPSDRLEFTGEALIDHRALLEGLKGRVNVLKRAGVAYINIGGIRIRIVPLRKWLGTALINPETRKRRHKKDWTPKHWAQIVRGTFESRDRWGADGVGKVQGIRFFIRDKGMNTKTTFYDQSDEFPDIKSVDQNIFTVKYPYPVEHNILLVKPKVFSDRDLYMAEFFPEAWEVA